MQQGMYHGGRLTCGMIVVVFIATAFSGLIVNAEGVNLQPVENQSDIEIVKIEDDTPIPGELSKNWLSISNIASGTSVIYLDQDNELNITIMNTGGDAGDEEYLASICDTIAFFDVSSFFSF